MLRGEIARRGTVKDSAFRTLFAPKAVCDQCCSVTGICFVSDWHWTGPIRRVNFAYLNHQRRVLMCLRCSECSFQWFIAYKVLNIGNQTHNDSKTEASNLC